MKRISFPLFTIPLIVLALSAFGGKAQVQDSAQVKIEQWLKIHDSATDLHYLKKGGNGFIITHVLKTADPLPGEEQGLIEIWREHYFNLTGNWRESRTYVNENDSVFLEKDKCESIRLAQATFRSKYSTLATGTLELIEMPKFSWIEIPMMEGHALFDLRGNFFEFRIFEK